MEDVSDCALERIPFLFQPLGIKKRIKANALFKTPGLDVRLRTHRAYRRYARCVLNADEVRLLKAYLDAKPYATLAEFTGLDPLRIEHLIADLFYEAKNIVSRESTYYKELSEVERRIKFLRGFALACFLLLNALVLVSLFRITSNRGELCSITIPAAVLLLILFFAARFTYIQQKESYTKMIFEYFLVMDEKMNPLMNPSQEDIATIIESLNTKIPLKKTKPNRPGRNTKELFNQ
jgi:hypothetical protein